MLADIIKVKVLTGHTIYVQFEDGIEGEVDIAKIIPFEGIFSKLKDPEYFATVKINPEVGTIVWDNGADLAPDFIYSIITQKAA